MPGEVPRAESSSNVLGYLNTHNETAWGIILDLRLFLLIISTITIQLLFWIPFAGDGRIDCFTTLVQSSPIFSLLVFFFLNMCLLTETFMILQKQLNNLYHASFFVFCTWFRVPRHFISLQLLAPRFDTLFITSLLKWTSLLAITSLSKWCS